VHEGRWRPRASRGTILRILSEDSGSTERLAALGAVSRRSLALDLSDHHGDAALYLEPRQVSPTGQRHEMELGVGAEVCGRLLLTAHPCQPFLVTIEPDARTGLAGC
jgi:hypothetical protein